MATHTPTFRIEVLEVQPNYSESNYLGSKILETKMIV